MADDDAAGARPTAIPVELVSAGRELTEPRLSPDGSTVAFVQRWGARAAITLVAVDGGTERMLTTAPDPQAGRGLGGGCFDWLPDGSGVVYVAVDGELWMQRFQGAPQRLTSLARACAAPAASPTGGFVVVAVDEAEIWRIPLDLAAAPHRLDDGADAFCFDPAVAPDGDLVSWQAWSPPDMAWDGACRATVRLSEGDGVAVVSPVERWRPDGGALQQPRFAPDGVRICVHDGSGWLNVSLDTEPVAAEAFEHADPTWGMGQRSYAVSPDGQRVVYARNEGGFGRLCVADRVAGTVTIIGRGVHGALSWVGSDVVALRSGARTPTQIVRYDLTTGARSILAVGPTVGWDHIDLPEPELVEVPHDGSSLHARRYAAGAGRLLVWVHGGPTDQWKVDFRPRIAYWWSRGWDVLVVDPRGTTGHGRAYQRALNGRWGRLDVDDTAALIGHAHRLGWGSPDTTALIGGSSGGLTVLGVLADHGHLVVGGVAAYPVSDIAALASSTHRFEAHYTETLVGPAHDPSTAVRLTELSPVQRADRITKPLLIFHGTDDPVVPIGQSEHLVATIAMAGGIAELVVYEGEGHGFRDPLHQRDEYDRTERFLADVTHPSARPRDARTVRIPAG